MTRERLDVARALEQMAAAMSGNCEKALDGGGPFLPSLMLWYEGEDLSRPGAVVVFEPAAEPPVRPGEALRMARERLDGFTRGAAAWALAYEGMVSGNGHSSPVLMIEAHLRSPAAQGRLARPFRPRTGTQPFSWAGDFKRL